MTTTTPFRGPLGERDGRDDCVEGLLVEDGLITRIRATFDPWRLL